MEERFDTFLAKRITYAFNIHFDRLRLRGRGRVTDMLKLQQAVFQQNIGISFPQPVTHTIFGWYQCDDNLEFLPKPERDKVDDLADLIVSSYAQTVWPPFRFVHIVGHADKDRHGNEYELSVSKHRAYAARDALENSVRQLWVDRKMGRKPKVFFEWWLEWRGSTQMIAPPYHAENRRVVVTLERTGAPLAQDTLLMKINRWLVLLDSRKITPDPKAYFQLSAAKMTEIAKCLLRKLRPDPSDPDTPNPNVAEVFIDGGLGEQQMPTINGRTPKYYDCYPINGRAVGWKGNYDGSSAHVQPAKGTPMPESEFLKFLSTLSPILKGEGFESDKSNDQILAGLGAVIQRINDGMNLVDAYIQISGLMQQHDLFIKALLKTDGFTGDNARSKLRNLYVSGVGDDNNIYSCWR